MRSLFNNQVDVIFVDVQRRLSVCGGDCNAFFGNSGLIVAFFFASTRAATRRVENVFQHVRRQVQG